jgi:hypothetical protein
MLFFNAAQSLTNVGGVLLSNTIWTSSGNANPYYLVRDVQIPRGISLTIEAGVEICFNKGDFEIFVKGFLHIQGTAENTKWMLNFQATQLNQTSISGAIFRGPKKGLQTTSAAPGLQQNTGVLLLQSVAFLNNATLSTNGKRKRRNLHHTYFFFLQVIIRVIRRRLDLLLLSNFVHQ